MKKDNLENTWGWLGLGSSANGEGKRAEKRQKDHDDAFEGAADIIVPEPEED